MTGGLLAGAAWGLAACAAIAIATWLFSLRLYDVSIVDIAWGWLVVTPALVCAALLPAGPRAPVVLTVALAWAARLSIHISWRHRGQGEDRRYRAIRARNQPHFGFKSLYLVFGLQAVLAWMVSAPLIASVASDAAWTSIDLAGTAIAICGLAIEAIADAQLSRFKARSSHRGRVLQSGLWRFSRHPNYFGEFCMWWGFGLMAVAAGGWWALASPIVMTVLLLKVSGVTLLEAGIAERRPAYEEYVRRTNAFFPWSPRA